MNFRITLLLLVLVGVLVGLLFVTKVEPEGPASVPRSLLDGHAIAQATRLRWHLRDQEPIELTRAGNEFWISQPLRDLASVARVAAIATAYDQTAVSEAFGDRKIDDELLQQCGLMPPVATFTATFKDGRAVTVELGGGAVFGSALYLRREGKLYQGGQSLLSALQVTVEELREKRLFANTAETAHEVTVDQKLPTGVRERMVLQRQDRRWRLMAPVQGRTEEGATNTFLRVLFGLRADLFMASVMVPPDRPPDVTITAEGDFGHDEVVLWEDERSGLLYGHQQARALDFQLDSNQISDLFNAAMTRLRARWLLPGGNLNETLARVVIDPGHDEPRLRLERHEGELGFRIHEPVEAIAGETPVAELLQALNNCRVLQFVDGLSSDPKFGLGGSALTLGVQCQGYPVLTTLKIGNDAVIGEIDVTYAIRVDEPEQVVAIPQPVAQRLRRHWSDYVRLELGKVPPVGRLLAVRKGPGGEERREFKADGSRWYRDGAKLPDQAVGEMVPELRDLRAVRASRRDKGQDPTWTLSLQRPEGDEVKQFLVFERGAELPCWLQPSGQTELLYEVNKTVDEGLRAIWKD